MEAPPLTGLKVLEFAGLAPGPFAGMMLADAGAQVLRIDRATSKTHSSAPAPPTDDMLARHKTSIAVDMKSASGIALLKQVATKVDILIDPFRPGVLERLGLGPDVLLALNPRLVYARMTGFRRDGRYSAMAGHDINYLAVSGTLGLLGRAGEKPHPPWNILADFAGGGAMLVQGILMAVLARSRTGRGQVVEANMVDGSSYLSSMPRMGLKVPHLGGRGRGENLLDGGCPYYDTYETKDGGYVAVGALEPQFFKVMAEGTGIGERWNAERYDVNKWPELKGLLERAFRGKTRAEWEKVFDGTDACVTPVLGYRELERGSWEGDQRPHVTLRETPLLAVKEGKERGQGKGVKGEGYAGVQLSPGEGGEEVLKSWMGWNRGREYEVAQGGLVAKEKARL